MVRPRGMISISDKHPEFFKVYLPQLSSQRLSIPPAFIKKFNGNIPKKAVLKNLSGRLWHVELEEVGKGLFIQNGWQGFVRDNSLEHGDFLVFAYSQNSIFDVKLFGKDGCKKEDALAIYKTTTYVRKEDALAIYKTPTYVKKEQDPEAEQTYSKSTRVYKRKFSETGLKRIEKSEGSPEVSRYKTRRVAETNVEKRKVFEAAEFVAPKNPHFITFISKSNRYCVNIPRSVVNNNNIKLKPDMKLRDQSGKLWPVTVVCREDGRINITGGWVNFRKENKLGLQDKCVFEFVLIGRISKEMRVQIFPSVRTQKYGRHETVTVTGVRTRSQCLKFMA